MRLGKNPTKFARHHSNIVSLDVKVPERLSIATVTYVPRLTDYYTEGLDILKLTLNRIIDTTPEPFDLMVFDNGSCKEVRDYLCELNAQKKITWLCLSPYNLKKLGAMNYLLSSAQGDLVYYFDSDIFHYDGWYEATKRVMDAYPEAGMVNAAPVASSDQEVMQQTMEGLQSDENVECIQGAVFSVERLKDNALRMNTDVDAYVEKATQRLDRVYVRKGVKALAIASHSHFLIRGEVLRKIMPLPRDWHLNHKDKHFDLLVAQQGYWRLGTLAANVAHLGNVLTDRWRNVAQEQGIELSDSGLNPGTKRTGLKRIIMENRLTRQLLLKLHGLTFRLLYNVR